MDKKKPEQDSNRNKGKKQVSNRKRTDRYPKRNVDRNRRDGPRGPWRGRDDYGRGPRRPRNIRYGTTFCGECRACEFWVTARFGRYRCENSYLPFEILEFRRQGSDDQITEIVLNLLV